MVNGQQVEVELEPNTESNPSSPQAVYLRDMTREVFYAFPDGHRKVTTGKIDLSRMLHRHEFTTATTRGFVDKRLGSGVDIRNSGI